MSYSPQETAILIIGPNFDNFITHEKEVEKLLNKIGNRPCIVYEKTQTEEFVKTS